MIKLTLPQKLIAVAFIIYTAIQGGLIMGFILQKDYLPIGIPLVVLSFNYYILNNMMVWAANNKQDEPRESR